MGRTLSVTIGVLALSFFLPGGSAAWGDEFYSGKQVRLIVGYDPGGGPDIRARIVARHLGDHIPGHPKVIVQNMPGAGGVIATNFVANVVKPDGLTLMNVSRDSAITQLGGRTGVQFDLAKFEWLGSVMREGNVVFIRSDLPYRNIDELRKATRPLIFAARAAGATNYIAGKGLETLGVPVKMVLGYGTAKLNIAFEQGEAEASALGWAALASGRPDWVKPGGLARLVVEFSAKPTPGIDVAFGPALKPIPGKEEIYQLINKALGLPIGNIGAPPGTPKERVDVLRRAYRNLVQDPKFKADAAKLGIPVDSLVGDDLAGVLRDFLAASPQVRSEFKELLQESRR